MGYSKEITGIVFDVSLPDWLRFFDCRASEKELFPEAPWTNMYGKVILFGSERAEVDLGLRTKDDRFGTTPTSCQTYVDARVCDSNELSRQVADMVQAATKLRQDWIEAAKHPSADGGSCYYKPVAICLSNYGWNVLCDTRTKRVRAFGANVAA